MTELVRFDLRRDVEAAREHFTRARRMWSLAHHASAFGAALFAAAATVVVAGNDRPMLAVWLSAATAFLSALTATGRFEQKWKSARLSCSRIRRLDSDLNAGQTDVEAARRRLLDVYDEHDIAVLGGGDSAGGGTSGTRNGVSDRRASDNGVSPAGADRPATE